MHNDSVTFFTLKNFVNGDNLIVNNNTYSWTFPVNNTIYFICEIKGLVSNINVKNSKFIVLKQAFSLNNISNNESSKKILEQCVYMAYDALLKELTIKLDTFKDRFEFTPLNETELNSDLEFMLKNIPSR